MSNNNFFTGTEGLDTRILLGTAEQKHMLASDRIMFATPANAGSSQTLTFTTGSSNLSAFAIIPGYDGYITIADSNNIEIGNNGTISTSSWINTSISGNIILKNQAFVMATIPTGNVTAYILSGSPTTTNLVPNAAGDYCNIVSQTAGCSACPSHYTCIDDPPGSHDGNSTYILTASTTQEKDIYNLPSDSLADDIIYSVTVHFVLKINDAGATCYGQPFLRLGSAETAGTEVAVTGDINWHIYSETLSRPGGGEWTGQDITNLQVGIGLRSNTAVAQCTQVYAAVSYQSISRRVTATGISSGQITASATLDTANLSISINEVQQDSIALGGTSIPDNANDWTFMSNSVPYADNITISVNGTQQLWFESNEIISSSGSTATLPDRSSGISNPGTIYWGSNPSGITLTADSMVSDFAAPVGAVELETPQITPVVEMPATMYQDETAWTLTNDPLYTWFDTWSTATAIGGKQIPLIFMWFFTFLVVAAIVFIVAYKFSHNLLISGILAIAVLGYSTARGLMPFWVIIVMILILLGLVAMERKSQL
jgi:hypothetical protein